MTKIKNNALMFAFALSIAFLGFGCEPASLKKTNSTVAETNAASPAEKNAADFESELQTLKEANYEYIFVFRRKDGGVLDAEDKKYLKANSPAATNRFILTDENKVVMAGSHFKFEPENMEKLQVRFAVENFSKPEAQTNLANSNSVKKGEDGGGK